MEWLLVFGASICVAVVGASLCLTTTDLKLLLQKKSVLNGRTYSVALPKKITNNTKVVLGLDGFGGSGKRFAYYTALHNVDPTAIVIYPDPVSPIKSGVRKGWNAGFCCGSGWVQKTDDVAFLKELVEYITNKYDVLHAKKFVVGFSNGAFMAQRLATDAPGLLSAIAVVAGTVGTEDTRLVPRIPIPIFLAHGLEDKVVQYSGNVHAKDSSFAWLSFEQTRRAWEHVNKEKAEVKVRTFPGGGHAWRGWRTFTVWRRKPMLSREVSAFFDSYNSDAQRPLKK